MRGLAAGIRDILFPQGKRRRQVSYKYLTLFLVLPILSAIAMFLLQSKQLLAIYDSAVIAESFGVLGGLLFAHAIFVFQLRVNYDSAKVEPQQPSAGQRDLRVRPLIDQMFTGVLYASLVALLLTAVTSVLAAITAEDEALPPVTSAIVVGLAAHLVGCVWHVISATTTAYSVLRQQER